MNVEKRSMFKGCGTMVLIYNAQGRIKREMKIKQKLKRILSLILVMATVLCSIPTEYIYAGNSEIITEKIADELRYEEEIVRESIIDALSSPNKKRDWDIAVWQDGYWYSSFHREVQEHIRDNNSKIAEKELQIVYRDENGNKTGTGRADLYMVLDEETTYLWEVKPFSYMYEPQRTEGIKQLKGYVDSEPEYFHGGMDIADGEFTLSKSIHRGTYIEHVTYTITYKNAGNGMIYYKFKRSSTKEELEKEPSTVPSKNTVTRTYPSYGLATGDILWPENPGKGNEQEEPEINWSKYTGYVSLAVAVQAYCSNKYDDISAALRGASGYIIDCAVRFFANPTPVFAAEMDTAITDFNNGLEAIFGPDLVDDVQVILMSGNQEMIDHIIKLIQDYYTNYERATTAMPPRDPLVIDLGAEGITLRSIENGVNFDLDNNGFAEKTAWIGNEDGFLALDRNGNGVIDNGGELFGDQVILSDGSQSASGFEALSDVDGNQDGVINSQDEVFNQLLVWIDANHSGTSECDELKSLSAHCIISISLDHTEISLVDDETGARIAETSLVEISNAGNIENVEISEFWFPIDSSDTTVGGTVTAGNVPDLNQAIMDDETGTLFKLCYEFSESQDIVEKRYIIKQILYFMAGASDIPAGSRGGNMDARDLKVVEMFMGTDFEGVGGSDPNSAAASILKGIYSDIENQYYNIINMYSGLGGYLKAVCEYEDENGNEVAEFGFLYHVIDEKIESGENVDTLVYDLGIYLKSYDEIKGTRKFNEYSSHFVEKSAHYAEIVELAKSANTYLGTADNDYYGGFNRNDFVFGEEGNDILNGGNGIDYIYGKEGNDTISGGNGNDKIYAGIGDDVIDGGAGNDVIEDEGGNDTYTFAKGYGADVITDNGGSNKLRFNNLTAKDILVNGTGERDVTINIKGTSDTLVIKNFMESGELADYTLIFKDKTMHCTDAGSPFRHIFGSDSDDVLKAVVDGSMMHAFGGNDTVIGSEGIDVIYGNSGNDTITAGAENDVVYGGADDDLISGESGDDVIWGESGCDTIDGGVGNDYLFGGQGDDTYVFATGYGRDIVEDFDGVSTIKLEETLENITVHRAGDEALIRINGTEDVLIISGYGTNAGNWFVEAGDAKLSVGDVITDCTDAVLNDFALTIGTSDSDAIFAENAKNMIASGAQYDYVVGGSDADMVFGGGNTDRALAGTGADLVYGSEGNDQLYGEDDNDFIVGGTGNDYINGGTGDDVIAAGAGDDFTDGGAGNDTYFFNAGDGCDSIMDSEGSNVILFGDGICQEDIKAYRQNWNDLLITFGESADTLVIKNYCVDEAARNFELIFADGFVYGATDAESALKNINDNSGTEYMPSIYPNGITLVSTDGDDQLTGSDEADTLIGGNGNNRITGNAGNDSLSGGAGRDYLYGGLGSDTYIYKKGYGTDTFSDYEGTNYIEISDYTASEVMAYRTNWNDVTLVLDGSGEAGLYDDLVDKIVLEGFFTSENARRYYIAFNGSRYYATASNSPIRTVYGTVNGDYMQGFDNSNITLVGGEGADTLNGADGQDNLYGGNGDDRLLGFAGKDTLDGGAGEDFLEGGAGDDTYIFSAGSGIDTINDNQGVNVISFGEGLNKESLVAYRTNWNDLTVTFAGVEAVLVIQGYFTSADNRKFDVEFLDGSRFEYTDLENPVNKVYASENDDWMSSWSDEGIWLNAGAGNDNVTGGLGNDVLIGGVGNDSLSGGAGDDTYVFNAGDGCDTIIDAEGVSKLLLGNVMSGDVIFAYETDWSGVNLVITLNSTGDSIKVNGFCTDNFVIGFADGVAGKVTVSEAGVVFAEIVIENE